MFHLMGIDVGNSFSDLRSWDSSTVVDDLLSNFISSDEGTDIVHELIVELVSSSVDLDFVHVVSIDGWNVHSTESHASGEDLVSEEVVTPDCLL